MKVTKYLDQVFDPGDGTTFVLLRRDPGEEVRARRGSDGTITIERWAKQTETVIDLEPGSLSRLQALAEKR